MLYQTAAANDGSLHSVTGRLETIMAGLACGEPNSIAWEIIGNLSDGFISCPDYTAAQGMRILGNPLAGDTKSVQVKAVRLPWDWWQKPCATSA